MRRRASSPAAPPALCASALAKLPLLLLRRNICIKNQPHGVFRVAARKWGEEMGPCSQIRFRTVATGVPTAYAHLVGKPTQPRARIPEMLATH